MTSRIGEPMGTVTVMDEELRRPQSHPFADDGHSLYGSADVDQCCHIADHNNPRRAAAFRWGTTPRHFKDDGFFSSPEG